MNSIVVERRPGDRLRLDKPRLVVVCSPKGGVGKTTISSNLLVAAWQRGIKAVGIDLDAQETLTKWHRARPQEVRDFSVRPHRLSEWGMIAEELLKANIDAEGKRVVDLVVVDTAPSVEDHILAVRNVLEDADLVVVPTKASEFDLNSILPWGKKLSEFTSRSTIILNQINRSASSWQKAQSRIVRARLSACPVVLPNSEDVSRFQDRGLALLDISKVRGDTQERFDALFDYVAKEVGL